MPKKKKGKKRKATIPKAIREQVWIKTFGKEFEHSCYITWCENTISVFDFILKYLLIFSF